MGEERRESRQYPRVVVGTKIKGQTHGIERGSVLNLSVGGALIEHAKIVRPGTILSLVLNLQRRETRVRCRVVWSAAHRAELQPNGQEELIYRTGVEFVGPPIEPR
ncbi:MAG: PilZ domain-containing protein [Nitrospiraceae bacterium]